MKTVMYTFPKELWMKLSLSFKYIMAAETGIEIGSLIFHKKRDRINGLKYSYSATNGSKAIILARLIAVVSCL